MSSAIPSLSISNAAAANPPAVLTVCKVISRKFMTISTMGFGQNRRRPFGAQGGHMVVSIGKVMRGNYFFKRQSLFETSNHRSRADTMFRRDFGCFVDNPVALECSSSGSVKQLLPTRSPLAVLRCIAKETILPLQRVLGGWFFAHVSKKVSEPCAANFPRRPSVANDNAFPSIIMVVWSIRLAATPKHGIIGVVKGMFSHAVL